MMRGVELRMDVLENWGWKYVVSFTFIEMCMKENIQIKRGLRWLFFYNRWY